MQLHELLELPGLREAPRGSPREDQLVVEGYLEDPVSTFDEGGINTEALLERVRQTGGAGLVVSNNTILDLGSGHDLPTFACIPLRSLGVLARQPCDETARRGLVMTE